jgi:hypothetical protein
VYLIGKEIKAAKEDLDKKVAVKTTRGERESVSILHYPPFFISCCMPLQHNIDSRQHNKRSKWGWSYDDGKRLRRK